MMTERMGESGIDTRERCEMIGRKAMSASSSSVCVIIVCRNPGRRLHAALESVWAQTIPPELVVVDGASTDGTGEWLRERSARISTLISEPDSGVYDAMNKGVAAARAGWIIFLGADDRLATPTVIAEAATHLNHHNAEVVVGQARYDDGRLYSFAGEVAAVRRNFVHHQASFYRRTPGARAWFDTSFRLQADYDHNLRLLHSGARYRSLTWLVAKCASGGLSDAGRWTNYREEIIVRHRHFPLWCSLPWDFVSVIRYLRKRIVRNFASTRPE
jgi:putative colanic acid biosynthesis glycosyltransferase